MTATSHEPPTDEQLIRRGRGEGFAALRRDPSLTEVALNSALVDDRWDGIDERADYLAKLLLLVPVDLSLLIADATESLGDLSGDARDHGGFSTDVLIRLAARGERRSATALRKAIEKGVAGSGSWVTLVEEVWEAGVPGLHDDLADLVLVPLKADALWDCLRDTMAWSCGPWPIWAREDADLAAVLDDAERRYGQPVGPAWRGLSDADLLAEVRSAPPRMPAWPLGELGRRGHVDAVLEAAARPELRNSYGALPGLGPALAGLAATERLPRVLEATRAWGAGDDVHLRDHAVRFLADHGDQRDVPFLIQDWNHAMEDDDYCAPEHLAPAFARLGVTSAVPHLLEEFQATPHSFARADVLAAIAVLDPAAAEPLLGPALLDCEDAARELAAQKAPLTSSVLAVLADLAADEHEDDDVRAAAARRLGRVGAA